MERGRLEALIQAQLDDELSAGERAELARLLLQDADARRLHDEFSRVERLLRDVPAAQPPPGLREDILAGSAKPGRAADAGSARRWAYATRIAAAFAGVILIAGVAYVFSDGRPPGEDLQGSLQAGRGPEVPGAGALEAQVSLHAEGIAVDAALHRDGGTYRLELGSAASMPVEVAVRIDPATTSLAGGAADSSTASADEEIVVRLPAGRQRATLNFAGAAPLRLELRAGGRMLQSAEFPLSGS